MLSGAFSFLLLLGSCGHTTCDAYGGSQLDLTKKSPEKAIQNHQKIAADLLK